MQIFVGTIIPIVMMSYYLYRATRKKATNFFVTYFFAVSPFLVGDLKVIRNVLIIGGIVYFLMELALRKRKKIFVNPYFLALLPLAFASYLYAPNKEMIVTGLTNISFLFLAYTYFSSVMSIKDFQDILSTMRINVIVLSILGFIEFYLTQSRISVGFFNSNYLALYLMLGYATFLLGERKSKLGAFITAAGVFLTGSRIAIAALFIPFLLMMKSRRGIVIGLIGAITAFSILLSLDFGRLGSESSSGSDSERQAIFMTAWEMIKENPVFGIGYHNFITSYAEYSTRVDYHLISEFRDQMVTHNDVLKILTELGIIGFIVLILFLKNGRDSIKKTDERFRLILSAWFWMMLAFTMTHNHSNSLEFWLFLSFASFLKFRGVELQEESAINKNSVKQLKNEFLSFPQRM